MKSGLNYYKATLGKQEGGELNILEIRKLLSSHGLTVTENVEKVVGGLEIEFHGKIFSKKELKKIFHDAN